MVDVFLAGTLCYAPLRIAVLGRDVAAHPARLADHAVIWAEGQPFALTHPAPDAVAEGLVLRGVTAGELDRLAWYQGVFGNHAGMLDLMDGAGAARVWLAEPGLWLPGPRWSLDDWVSRHGAVMVATASDVMQRMGGGSPAALRWRLGSLLVRGAARIRAAAARPSGPAHRARPGDVVVDAWKEPYAAFFAVEEFSLRHLRFEGGMGAPIDRAVFVSADAVTVLPYDPVRDRVMLIEQFRAAPFARGDANPWLIEAIAGRIDPFETAEDTARREAVEEAGVTLGALHRVAEYYPSPGGKTEYLWSYVGIADLPDTAAGLGGLASEGEDIRAHLMTFDAFMALVDDGAVANGPLVLTAFWLARHRDRLRAG